MGNGDCSLHTATALAHLNINTWGFICCLQVAADQEQAEKVKGIVGKEEKEVKQMQQDTQIIADSAKADLDEALPALNAALNALKALNKNDIVEIKSFAKPPSLVQLTMEAVCVLKGEKPDWDTAKRLLGDGGFLKSLEEFDKVRRSSGWVGVCVL